MTVEQTTQAARYLRVRNWHKFQHYTDRNPPWIKNYLNVDDPSHPFSKLSYADQGRLQKLWRVAARLDNEIPYDGAALSRIFGGKADAILRSVDRYVTGEWLQVGTREEVRRWEKSEKRAAKRKKPASRQQAGRKQTATPEVETETDQEEEIEAKPELSANFRIPDPLARLIAVLPDKTDLTVERIESMHRKYRFAEGDFVEAIEAATSESCVSPSAVAISVLKARAAA